MADGAQEGTWPCHMPGAEAGGHERNEHRQAWLPLTEFMVRGAGGGGR